MPEVINDNDSQYEIIKLSPWDNEWAVYYNGVFLLKHARHIECEIFIENHKKMIHKGERK